MRDIGSRIEKLYFDVWDTPANLRWPHSPDDDREKLILRVAFLLSEAHKLLTGLKRPRRVVGHK